MPRMDKKVRLVAKLGRAGQLGTDAFFNPRHEGLRYSRSFCRSFCDTRYRKQRSLLRTNEGINRISTSMACNLTRGFC